MIQIKLKHVFLLPILALSLGSAPAFSDYSWEDDDGGIFNIPPVEYNPYYYGYGSSGQTIYNKIDLQTGESMYISNDVWIVDNQGSYIATAETSPIGWDHDLETRDGGIVAGAITEININGTDYTMAYAWSVNTTDGGRTSGWINTEKLSPNTDIVSILWETRTDRLALIQDDIDEGDYTPYTIVETTLPSWAEDYYLDPDRDASYTAGKAKYYYSRDEYLTGLKNIPETGSQRYGVGHDMIPLGATFYRDMNVDRVNVYIYPPSSSDPINHKLRLVWGYMETSAGWKIYSWVNERALD